MEQLSYYVHGIEVAIQGAGVTLEITSISILMGLFIGFFIALLKMSSVKILKVAATIYIEVLRGTPILVQVLILAFGIPNLLTSISGGKIDFNWSSMMLAGIIACGINSSAYVAEIIRGGMQAVDRGQYEAARSIGMSHFMSIRHVISPQAFKIVLPALGNEFISLLKETSILSVISIVEVTRRGQLWAASDYRTFPAYFGVAVVYLAMTLTLSGIVLLIEKRMNK